MEKWTPKTPDCFLPADGSKIVIQPKSVEGSGGPTFTVDEAVNKVGYGAFQIKLTILSGLGWMADAFEIIILSILGQMITCEWKIVRYQNALLSSVVFASMMIVSPVFGIIADKYGRRTSLLASLMFLFLFGEGRAASPNYNWMLVFRAFTGFALGGLAQVLTICTEYFPKNMRGRAGFYLCYFWALGTIGVILLSWGIMSATNNWRILLALAAVPAFLVIISMKWFPESARFYLVSNQHDKAVEIITEMANENRKSLPEGRLYLVNESPNRGRILDLLTPQYRLSTLLFWYLWIASAFSYYGIALASPFIIQSKGLRNLSVQPNQTLNDFTAPVNCVRMTDSDYLDLLWTSAAEFPGLLVFTFLVELFDRKKLMCVACLTCCLFILLLLIETSIEILLLIFLFISRGILISVFQMALIMTAEAFPTTLRAVAMGTGSGWGRLGALTSPYVSQVLLITNPIAAICLFGGVIGLAGIATVFLPKETRGRDLTDVS